MFCRDVRCGCLLITRGRFVRRVRCLQLALAAHATDRKGGHWEAAEVADSIQQRYDLRDLGLAGRDSSSNSAGAALLEVLRGGGKVQRAKTDPAMLKVCQVLSRLLQIKGSLFQYSNTCQTWSALFEASSNVTPETGEK